MSPHTGRKWSSWSRFLGSTISQDLKWSAHVDTVRKKSRQRLYLLWRKLRKFNLPQELLIIFYTTIIQSVLCTSITVWFGSATKQDRHRLQRVVRSAESIHRLSTGPDSRAVSITADSTHTLPQTFKTSHIWQASHISTRTTRHRVSFFPQAVFELNSTGPTT